MYGTRVLIGLAAALMSQLTLADTAPVIANSSLGRIEATLAFCATVDPESAAMYQQKAQAFTKGLSAEKLTALRATSDYKTAYDQTGEELAQVSKDTALAACTGAIHG
jgi:hypothetical protein